MPNSSGESASSEIAPTIINSVEASSLDSAINLMNTYVSKEISLSHCKAIIISETLASEGISKLLYSLMNKVQIRPDANIIISRCLAKDFVEKAQPTLENLIAKYYEIAPISSKYTGYTVNATIGDFFNQFSCQTCQPVAILGSISTPNSSNANKDSNSFTSEKDSSNMAGSTSLENTGNSEMMGLAVFKEDKLVGELTAGETLCHLLLKDELESCNITIPNPEDKNNSIDLYLYNKCHPKVKVKIVNGSPLITINLKLEAKILSVDQNSNYITKESLAEISTSANQYIKNMICNYLYKISREFGTDIDGHGKYALPLFKTLQEYQEYNWLENYKNSFFSVNVDTNVQSAFLLSGK